ncbi:hypothetical protein [Streptomyces canus]|uniref:hypothetical protein n=1 Tax=Streptomyces canus TaxID=58343 RepID=UPI0030E15E63
MSTPRLDRIAATCPDIPNRIHLADDRWITVTGYNPDSDEFEDVLLFPGVDVPDGDAWLREDAWELSLTQGDARGGRLFVEVPLEAVRALIEDHGGEHPEQD